MGCRTLRKRAFRRGTTQLQPHSQNKKSRAEYMHIVQHVARVSQPVLLLKYRYTGSAPWLEEGATLEWYGFTP